MSEATTMQATLQRTDGTVRVPFEHLHDSPTQPRTFYDEAYIRELADSIKANGDILQPIMVRKRMPNVLRTEWDPADGFELIFGHCRKRAGMLAGLDSAPIQCVEMTDAQVQVAQLTENVKRKDLHFMDAAEGVARLRRQFDIPVDDLMKQTGMSKTYVYNQIKLADACDEVKQACRNGRLDNEIATLIARIKVHKLQASALKVALEKKGQHDGRGYRDTRKELLDKYALELKSALWTLDDALLVPSAGACTTCPDRSGATPELFKDVVEYKPKYYYDSNKAGKDICMNPECFATKKKAQLDLDARALASQGKTVVTGNAAKQALTAGGDVKGAYVAVADVKALLKTVKGGERPQTVLIQDQRSGKTVEAIKRADLAGTGVKVPDEKSGREATSARQEAERKKWNAKAAMENEARQALLTDVRRAMLAKPRTLFDLRMVAKRLLQGIYGTDQKDLLAIWGAKSSDALKESIDHMPPDQVAMLMMDRLLIENMEVEGHELQHGYGAAKPGHLFTLAKHHGIDPKAHRAAFDAAKGLPTPPPAAQARGEGARKATKGQPVAKPEPKYRNTATGETWSGKGLMPKWFQVAMAAGKRPVDFETAPIAKPAGAGPADTGTLPLGLEDSIQPAAPEGSTKTAEAVDQARLQPAWPFPKPGPLAPEVSDDAGPAGGSDVTAAAVATTELEAQ